MTSGRDDDALSWDGDDDPTLDVGVSGGDGDAASDDPPSKNDPARDLPPGFTPVGKGSEAYADAARVPDSAAAAAPEHDESAPSTMGNAELISLGVIGGFSLLYAIGWLIGGLRLQGTAEFLVAPLAYQVSLWLAVLAPLAWFATTLVLTRSSRLWVRFAWLVGGVVLLVPWPFIMVGAIGR
ncbi:DNA polymerase III subunit gamma/tau [Microbacterium sp. NPDC057407]|uniref:DNA polymerase III subunit gamma/tau n=1 Tax=Microbacterium sp. NPDC057407 TaxID=3346120 RepID=UPI003671DFA2